MDSLPTVALVALLLAAVTLPRDIWRTLGAFVARAAALVLLLLVGPALLDVVGALAHSLPPWWAVTAGGVLIGVCVGWVVRWPVLVEVERAGAVKKANETAREKRRRSWW